MLTPPRGPTPDSSMRLVAMGLAGELRDGALGLGGRSFFRTAMGWHAHGFHGDLGSDRLREICSLVFGSSDHDAGEIFSRGMRSVFSLRVEGQPEGTTQDVDAFWGTVARLREVTGVELPSAPDRSSGPMIRGH